MNDIFSFFIFFAAILIVLVSIGIMIFFGLVLYQQHVSAYSYEECINEFIDPQFCNILIPPLPYYDVNWTLIPFP